jgi:hypothetical protein
MRGRLQSAALLVSMFATATSLAGAVGGWREAWDISLTSSLAPLQPCSLRLVFQNRGASPLKGEGATFSLYRDGAIYGWAVDPVLRGETITVPVGLPIARETSWAALTFLDLEGNAIPSQIFASEVRTGDWTIQFTLADSGIQKPTRESSYLVSTSAASLVGALASACLSPNKSLERTRAE